MKIRLSILFMVFCVGTGSSQVWRSPSIKVEKISGSIPDSSMRAKILERLSLAGERYNRDTLLPYNGMPNAITRKPAPDLYMGNNGRGSDIYRSQPDNMPILKPDSSFASGMFTGRNAYRPYGNIYNKPQREKTPGPKK